MLKAGDKIGEYKILEELGEGTFGKVYLAEWQTRKGTRKGALKILKAPKFKDILEEVSNWGRVSHHENVLTFFGAKLYCDEILIISEYMPDGSLEDWLKKNGGKAPSTEVAVQMMISILRGLEHLHENDILHRDLKPANILLKDETPLLADFGLARGLNLINSDGFGGSPLYNPPEAFSEAERTEHLDLWAVAVIFYELLTGRIPFDSIEHIFQREPKHYTNEISQELHEFINKVFQKEATKRFQTANEMRSALDKILNPLIKAAELKKTIDDENWKIKFESQNLPKKFTNSINIKFVRIPAGEFLMGTDVNKVVNDRKKKLGLVEPDPEMPFPEIKFILREIPQHLVEIPYSFYMSRYTITQRQWETVMGNNPSYRNRSNRLPVNNVSWYDAKEFIARLNEMSDDYFYRLPSEAEWEYACRAGTNSEYYFGDQLYSSQSSFNEQIRPKGSTSVGSFKPNKWGLYDMHGNIWEWCEDIFSGNYANLPTNGSPNLSVGDEKLRVLRGGSWGVNAFSCRSAYRSFTTAKTIRPCNGFRLVASKKQ